MHTADCPPVSHPPQRVQPIIVNSQAEGQHAHSNHSLATTGEHMQPIQGTPLEHLVMTRADWHPPGWHPPGAAEGRRDAGSQSLVPWRQVKAVNAHPHPPPGERKPKARGAAAGRSVILARQGPRQLGGGRPARSPRGLPGPARPGAPQRGWEPARTGAPEAARRPPDRRGGNSATGALRPPAPSLRPWRRYLSPWVLLGLVALRLGRAPLGPQPAQQAARALDAAARDWQRPRTGPNPPGSARRGPAPAGRRTRRP
ncbi:unnamed protein product [Nyctereutes procyonoides]|uniref:(raccoon dog) hypothetical protein n=1 Tax=Nyctereutes procyonoides TaxID=34880 RepID=A0A811YLN8_NYCPR|nr:unnamed protein product [Nyctereutes procyonoides]